MKSPQEYYAILGLLPTADWSVVRSAHEALLNKYQTGMQKGETDALQELQLIEEAFQFISGFTEQASEDPGTLESEADWMFALEYYPDLTSILERLATFSKQLPAMYRSALMSSRNFSARKELEKSVEDQFFYRHFGQNEKIVQFARDIFRDGHLTAANELSRAVKLFGDDPETIIRRIRGKYIVIQAINSLPYSADARRILLSALNDGNTIEIDERDKITVTKSGGSKIYLYSDEDILSFGR